MRNAQMNEKIIKHIRKIALILGGVFGSLIILAIISASLYNLLPEEQMLRFTEMGEEIWL